MIPKKIYVPENSIKRLCHYDHSVLALVTNFSKEGSTEYTDLSQVWHEAEEEPQTNYKNIMYQTNYCSRFNIHIASIPTCLRSCKITARSWDEFVKEVNMKRWAYIDDLLPKEGL